MCLTKTKVMKMTVEDIMAMKPCYKKEHVCKLFGSRHVVTPYDVATSCIPYPDKLWVLLRWPGLHNALRIKFAMACVKHAPPSSTCSGDFYITCAMSYADKEQNARAAADAARASIRSLQMELSIYGSSTRTVVSIADEQRWQLNNLVFLIEEEASRRR